MICVGTFFEMLANLWQGIIAVFDSHPIQIWDYKVSVTSIYFAILVVGFVISVYWKGAKS